MHIHLITMACNEQTASVVKLRTETTDYFKPVKTLRYWCHVNRGVTTHLYLLRLFRYRFSGHHFAHGTLYLVVSLLVLLFHLPVLTCHCCLNHLCQKILYTTNFHLQVRRSITAGLKLNVSWLVRQHLKAQTHFIHF